MWDDPTWATFQDLARAAPGWEDTMDRLDIRWILLSPDLFGRDLLAAALVSPRWEVAGRDGVSVLLCRRPGPGGLPP